MRKSRRVFTDRGWHTQTVDAVIVHRFLSVEFGTVCIPGKHDRPELSLDQKAERAAYRCAPGEHWQVHYLKKTDTRTFELCKPLERLNWDEVPSFEKARAGLLACGTAAAGEEANSFKQIFEESLKRNGETDAADFLIESAALDFSTPVSDTGDDWTAAFAKLPSSEQKRITRALAGRLATSDLLSYRLLLSADTAVLAENQDALARIAENAAGRRFDEKGFPLAWKSLDISLRILASRNPGRAAALACKAAAGFSANGMSRVIPRIQAALIARQKVTCNLDGIMERSVCQSTYACCPKGFTCADSARKPCGSAELDALVSAELARDPKQPWPPGSTNGDELLVAAARVQKTRQAEQFLARISAAPGCGLR